MAKVRRSPALDPRSDALFARKRRTNVPHEFVLEALGAAAPTTRPMFGCLAVYVGDKIVLALRDKLRGVRDNGVWIATTKEHHASLRGDFPHMRSIGVLGKEITGWQVLAADSPDFEDATLRACALILAGDPRIGKVPTSRTASKPLAETTKPPKSAKGSTRARR